MAATTSQIFKSLQEDPTSDRTIIIGGGIVGSALAYFLSTNRNPVSQIILLDASLSDPQGSTAFAPGFVGQLNTIKPLTEMAKESVAHYMKIPGAFQQVGGLEIARSEEGIAQLHTRHALASSAGLPAEIMTSAQAAKLAPDFVVDDGVSKALHFSHDGTVDQRLITRYYQEEAKSRGVVILPAKVTSISQITTEEYPASHSLSVTTGFGSLSAQKLIVATGIWTAPLVQNLSVDLPIIPVLHPYAYGPARVPRATKQPFVRWPERHVYARDHGAFDGWGSYDHEPIPCLPDHSALFSPLSQKHSITIDAAVSVLPDGEKSDSKNPHRVFQASFSVTADGMPLAGAVPQLPGLYVAAAAWITHAAGVAKLVADIVLDKELKEGDIKVMRAFDPMRFKGQNRDLLRDRALATYNDIYNKDTAI